MLIAPRQWTAANFTFQVSIDGQIPLAITDVLRSLRPDGDAVVDIQIKGSLLLRPFYAATAFDYRYDKIFLPPHAIRDSNALPTGTIPAARL